MMPPKLIFSLAMAFAIFAQSQALMEQVEETEIDKPNRANERWIRSSPLSRDVGASQIKRNTRIAEKIRDLRGTSNGKSKSGMKKKKSKSAQSMSKETKSKGGKVGGGNNFDGSDVENKKKSSKSTSENIKSKEGEGNSGDDSDGSNGDDSPAGDGGNDSDHSEGTNSPAGDGGNGSDHSEGTDSPQGDDFDISNCESYSNEWLSELASYCGDNLDDLSACECPPARELLADGTLVCASQSELGMSPPACPEGCPVCEFCMVLEGCEDIYGL